MNNQFKILIPQYNPPKTYLKALNLVGLDCDCKFNPPSFNEYKGLLLIGGGDVYPFFYGKKIEFSNANLPKDAIEFKAIDYFYRNGLPILGVCRGLQQLNVFFGGTLKSVNFHQGNSRLDAYHPLAPTENGFLKGLKRVNSNHRQCVDQLCKQAKDVCFSTDGTVEGFSIGDNILAVQFHPERMDISAIITVYGEFAKMVKAYAKI
ncbi:MAG: gamma-glutamyl-gamma-aminobutyrate hydrolase family protein [Clostridia bacterium]|nr:gamma-glutamyl-gamma-aminobutyrate hydrolase family protein [Clostridia bacterium]